MSWNVSVIILFCSQTNDRINFDPKDFRKNLIRAIQRNLFPKYSPRNSPVTANHRYLPPTCRWSTGASGAGNGRWRHEGNRSADCSCGTWNPAWPADQRPHPTDHRRTPHCHWTLQLLTAPKGTGTRSSWHPNFSNFSIFSNNFSSFWLPIAQNFWKLKFLNLRHLRGTDFFRRRSVARQTKGDDVHWPQTQSRLTLHKWWHRVLVAGRGHFFVPVAAATRKGFFCPFSAATKFRSILFKFKLNLLN